MKHLRVIDRGPTPGGARPGGFPRRAIALLVALAALLSAGIAGTAGNVRFALALAQGVRTYSSPSEVDSTDVYEMPILSPHRVMEERRVGGMTWYRVERRVGTGAGWVPADLVEVWNSRHALRPVYSTEGHVPGYGDVQAVQRAVDGEHDPIMRFTSTMLKMASDRAPFPVVDVKEFEPTDGGNAKTYMQVLVPTLYSNIAPVKRSAGDVTTMARTLEVMILIDATGSMQDEIAVAARALEQMVDEVSRFPVLAARFLVLAYRDTQDATPDCPVMESTSPVSGRLEFTTATRARDFLKSLKACGGGAGIEGAPEAVWDALYLLKGAPVTGAAARGLILVGDAPAAEVTRGGTWFGTTVPPGIQRRPVFEEVQRTIGASTTFVAHLAGVGLKGTAEQILGGFQFTEKTIIDEPMGGGGDLAPIAARVRTKMVEKLKGSLVASEEVRVTVEDCLKKLGADEAGAKVSLFCGSADRAADAALAARVRDLMLKDPSGQDKIVIRKLWIPMMDPFLDDVALLSRQEAQSSAAAMKALSEQAVRSKGGCREVGLKARDEVMSRLLPNVKYGHGVEERPVVAQALYEHWRLRVRSGRSLLRYTPQEMQNLSPEKCTALSGDLDRAANYVHQLLARFTSQQFVWLPFDKLP